MTAAAGAALSHLLSLHRLGGNISSESDAAIPAAGQRVRDHRRAQSFQPALHGPHELSVGTARPAGYSVLCITCSNLVEAGDDFACQYSQVIDRLIIY